MIQAMDLDMTGQVWLYRPGSDQGTHGTRKKPHTEASAESFPSARGVKRLSASG